jgi:hypothetical protein
MKLKKATLLKAINASMIGLGYQNVKDTITGAEGLFIKVVKNDFFLSLGLTISNFYDTRFTVSFYLSKITKWGATWGDIPDESYERPGKFLTKEERQLYLDKEHNDGIDVWWHSDREGDYEKFIQVIKITEPRFLGQKDLFFKIENSNEVQKLAGYVASVFRLMRKGLDDNDYKYFCLPKNKVDDIPEEWFKAAEMTLRQNGGIVTINTVKGLAGDAWRQNIIKINASKS